MRNKFKNYIIGLLIIISILLTCNNLYAYIVRYRIKIIVKGRTVITKSISKSEYERVWKYVVPYYFRENVEDEYCNMSARIKMRRIIH